MTEELKKKVIEILENIIDPEIGIDIYNLGLIYDIQIIDEKHVKISMGFTTTFCPLATYIPLMVIDQLKDKLGVDTDIDIVYDPPWNPTKMTEKGRALFKERFGYDIVETYIQSTRTDRE
ncbi:MAG: metal-sulfur cluster assembly factor [Desulfurococcaceae archaeon]